MRLAYEGLVVRSPNRGARVRRYSLEEAVEVLEARAALESVAAGYAALRRTGEEVRELEALIEDMRRLHAQGELLEMSERNAVLHRRILEISGHEVAGDIAERLHSQVVRFQFRTVLAAGRPPKSLRRARADRRRHRRRRSRRRRARHARAPRQRRGGPRRGRRARLRRASRCKAP